MVLCTHLSGCHGTLPASAAVRNFFGMIGMTYLLKQSPESIQNGAKQNLFHDDHWKWIIRHNSWAVIIIIIPINSLFLWLASLQPPPPHFPLTFSPPSHLNLEGYVVIAISWMFCIKHWVNSAWLMRENMNGLACASCWWDTRYILLLRNATVLPGW